MNTELKHAPVVECDNPLVEAMSLHDQLIVEFGRFDLIDAAVRVTKHYVRNEDPNNALSKEFVSGYITRTECLERAAYFANQTRSTRTSKLKYELIAKIREYLKDCL